ncbi:MAG: PIN domain-containing protein [Candidatus Parabeggiatoa sp.]|nr:PIN domain-containing protein [Candidatus Parabeggiatoa sp.]
MNIYVESNFVLELAFLQEQSQSCEKILALCESEQSHLVLPAFCITEPYDTLVRRSKDRNTLKHRLEIEFNQLSRTPLYSNQLNFFREVSQVLIQSATDEEKSLYQTLDRILKVCETIPVVPEILSLSATFRAPPLELSVQDSMVYASVVHHLTTHNIAQKCFLNRNSRDFNQPDIQMTLNTHNCKLLFNFEKGYNYIMSKTERQSA